MEKGRENKKMKEREREMRGLGTVNRNKKMKENCNNERRIEMMIVMKYKGRFLLKRKTYGWNDKILKS